MTYVVTGCLRCRGDFGLRSCRLLLVLLPRPAARGWRGGVVGEPRRWKAEDGRLLGPARRFQQSRTLGRACRRKNAHQEFDVGRASAKCFPRAKGGREVKPVLLVAT